LSNLRPDAVVESISIWTTRILGICEAGRFDMAGVVSVGCVHMVQFRFPDIAWNSESGSVVILY
jgi:hypothetical protein